MTDLSSLIERVDERQQGFNAGIVIGLNAALVVLKRGEGQRGVANLAAEIAERTRRMNGDLSGRAMVADDIFLKMPLMHPGDLGFGNPSHEG